MFLLFLAGPALEDRWGRPLFAAFYVVGGTPRRLFYSCRTTARSAGGRVGRDRGRARRLPRALRETEIRFAYFFFVGFRFLRARSRRPPG